MITQLVEKTRQQWRYRNQPLKAPEPDLDDYPIVSSEILRFADTDQNGHVANGVFSVLCQNARMDLFNDATRVEIPPGHMLPVVNLNIKFLAELHWPGTVDIGTRFNHIGRTSIGLDQVIFGTQRCVAKAQSTIVLIDKATRRPVPLPPEMIKQIGLFFSKRDEPKKRRTSFAWIVANARGGDW